MEPNEIFSTIQSGQPWLVSLVLFSILVFLLIGVLLFLSGWLGGKKESPEKIRPYECGVIPAEFARLRYPIPFYLVAVFFVVFDVEAAFIFSWAIALDDLGWMGWLRISFFIAVLLLSLIYVWRKGGLDWGPGTTTKIKT